MFPGCVEERVDRLRPEQRSDLMRSVRQKGTTPELIVRKTLHRIGYRFRLNRSDLPGRPDIVLPRYRTCIFVHGCFWHRHSDCRYATMPKARTEWWQEKFRANEERDRRKARELAALGWDVVVIWECETKDMFTLLTILRQVSHRFHPVSASRGETFRIA
ncbi:MAG: DNA mismatch endonuclease Vsr [Magnetococcales bacterium]|nr:DNA mismatch endonuclease Vsr [Magnetococcales bacterium]